MKVYRGVEALVASGALDASTSWKVRPSRQEDDEVWGRCFIVTDQTGIESPDVDGPVLAGVALASDSGEKQEDVLVLIEEAIGRRRG
jgi:hypothetical protein